MYGLSITGPAFLNVAIVFLPLARIEVCAGPPNFDISWHVERIFCFLFSLFSSDSLLLLVESSISWRSSLASTYANESRCFGLKYQFTNHFGWSTVCSENEGVVAAPLKTDDPSGIREDFACISLHELLSVLEACLLEVQHCSCL